MFTVLTDITTTLKFTAPTVLKEKVLPLDADSDEVLNRGSKVTTVCAGQIDRHCLCTTRHLELRRHIQKF
jgi:hypothetical protein